MFFGHGFGSLILDLVEFFFFTRCGLLQLLGFAVGAHAVAFAVLPVHPCVGVVGGFGHFFIHLQKPFGNGEGYGGAQHIKTPAF